MITKLSINLQNNHTHPPSYLSVWKPDHLPSITLHQDRGVLQLGRNPCRNQHRTPTPVFRNQQPHQASFREQECPPPPPPRLHRRPALRLHHVGAKVPISPDTQNSVMILSLDFSEMETSFKYPLKLTSVTLFGLADDGCSSTSGGAKIITEVWNQSEAFNFRPGHTKISFFSTRNQLDTVNFAVTLFSLLVYLIQLSQVKMK